MHVYPRIGPKDNRALPCFLAPGLAYHSASCKSDAAPTEQQRICSLLNAAVQSGHTPGII